MATVKPEELAEYLSPMIRLGDLIETKCPVCASKLYNIVCRHDSNGIAWVDLSFHCGQSINYNVPNKKYDMNTQCRNAVALLMNQKIDNSKTKPETGRFEGIK